ncbi:MAG: transcriptional repressor [Myxococcales bacterium]|nr:transcriptional repressor [Myxococcales bacterium]
MTKASLHEPAPNSEARVEEALELFHSRIGAAGLKSTRQRDAIVAHFFRINQHISVQELHDIVKEENARIGYATVYRTLKLLVDHDLAKPRDFGDGITRFDPLFGKPDLHDHLICVDCRRVFEFKDRELEEKEQAIAERFGSFRVARHKLELYATCTDEQCEHRPKS